MSARGRTSLVVMLVGLGCSEGDRSSAPDLASASTGGRHGSGGVSSTEGEALGGMAGEVVAGPSCQSGGSPCDEIETLCLDVECPGENQKCSGETGAPVCRCQSGFLQDEEGNCVDADECSMTDICGPGARCENLVGGYRCDCLPGFAPDSDGTCKDINECDLGVHSCDEVWGICSNLEGSYSCSCPLGMTASGHVCKPSSDCDALDCSSEGECLETPTGAVCACSLGRVGPTCEDSVTCSSATVLNGPESPVVVDPALRAALHGLTGIPPEANLTVGDLLPHRSLSIPSGAGVTSLEGIQCWTTLEELRIPSQLVTDLSPLSALYRLEQLDLSCNPVEELTPLTGLFQLKHLLLSQSPTCLGAQVFSLSPLEGLRSLSELSLAGQGLEEATSVGALVQLQTLDLSDNNLSGVGFVGSLPEVRALSLARNNLEDISPLASLRGLRSLNIAGNEVSNISALGDLSWIELLDMSDNDLTGLEPLSASEALRVLSVINNRIESLEPLAHLPRLSILRLQSNEITSIEALAENASLGFGVEVWTDENPLSCDLFLPALERLEARGVRVHGQCDSEVDAD